MIASAVVVALAMVGAASPAVASDKEEVEQLNQLETARLVQPAQRIEFGVEGEDSAFRFSFADPVCCLELLQMHACLRPIRVVRYAVETQYGQIFP